MQFQRIFSLLFALISFALQLPAGAQSGEQSGSWDSRFALHGVDRFVRAVAADDFGNVYIGGVINSVSGVPVHQVAKWDGQQWSDVGFVSPRIDALSTDSKGILYAGGTFGWAGTEAATAIARWDGQSWSAVGGGTEVGGVVRTLVVDGQDHVYAGGRFRTAGGIVVNNVARWNGAQWEPLGEGIDGWVEQLVIDGDGRVYALLVHDIEGLGIYTWQGSGWDRMNFPYDLTSRVGGQDRAIAIDRDGDLYVSGPFPQADGEPVGLVAKWDGAQWSLVGNDLSNRSELPEGQPEVVTSLVSGDDGEIFAVVLFRSSDREALERFVQWDGEKWLPVGSFDPDATSSEVAPLRVPLVLDSAGRLWAGGFLTVVDDKVVNGIAFRDGATWSSVGPSATTQGIDGVVTSIAVCGNDSVYVAGTFYIAGDRKIRGVARWDGDRWRSMGTGNGPSNSVRALACDPQGRLYAGGHFVTSAGSVSVFRWDGESWHSLGTGGRVNTLAVDDEGNLFAGGVFGQIGGVEANRIARWDGERWHALGAGISGGYGGDHAYVDALAVDASGNLFAGGHFTRAGEAEAQLIARWDGADWTEVGGGLNIHRTEAVNALAFDSGGKLYAGGSFRSTAGAEPVVVKGVAVWDGVQWQALDGGTDGFVFAFAPDAAGGLYAGGYFDTIGGVQANSVARWDGQSWSPLGAGISGRLLAIRALVLDPTGDLFVGGTFEEAGGKPSVNIARWLEFRDTSTETLPMRKDVLVAAYPNPFSVLASISVDVPESGPVRIDVYDMLGRRVAQLQDGPLPKGSHTYTLDGSSLPAGVYLLDVFGVNFRATHIVTRVR